MPDSYESVFAYTMEKVIVFYAPPIAPNRLSRVKSDVVLHDIPDLFIFVPFKEHGGAFYGNDYCYCIYNECGCPFLLFGKFRASENHFK